MKGMNELVRQAQIMQKKMAKLQEELQERTVEGTAGGGMVTAVVSGANELKSIAIDKTVVDPNDVEMLQDLVLAAVNDGLKKAKAMMEEEMGQLTGGIKMPGLF
ncbi:YbaB/EbfC family nucleoid-associated protein [Desulfovibrio sp. JY]|nr:YbaB/EbfC family nucleoid-associated protein [Desulfovibrio sp. JY]